MSYDELNKGRRRGGIVYDYFDSYCNYMYCCEECNHKIRFWCKIIDKIRDIQKKHILKYVNKRGDKYDIAGKL